MRTLLWDLDHPPSETHGFWMLPPKVQFEALIHFVHTGQSVCIPYNYKVIDFYQFKGEVLYIPKPKEERPTICTILQELNEVLESKYHKQHQQDEIDDPNHESRVRYTPKITAWNGDIAALEVKLERTTKNILTCEGSLKEERFKKKYAYEDCTRPKNSEHRKKEFKRKNQVHRNRKR